jgi:hypothetical protein
MSLGKNEKGEMEMVKKVMMCMMLTCFLSAGFAALGHAFACKCEGLRVANGGGIDWLEKKGDRCGASFTGGDKGTIKNDISDPFNFMSSKYYSPILKGTVESAYDPDSGWRCVNRNTY